jgi:hypothetical protein
MGGGDPWKKDISKVVGDQMEALLPVLLRPSNETVPAADVARSRGPCQAGDGSAIGKDNILEMLPYRMDIPQIMVLFHEGVEELLHRCASNLATLDGKDFPQFPRYGGLIHFYTRGSFSMDQRVVGGASLGRQLDVACPMQLKEKSPAYHLLEGSVLLHPVPCPAKPARQTVPAVVGMFCHDPLDEGHILCGSDSSSVCDSQVHRKKITHDAAERKG